MQLQLPAAPRAPRQRRTRRPSHPPPTAAAAQHHRVHIRRSTSHTLALANVFSLTSAPHSRASAYTQDIRRLNMAKVKNLGRLKWLQMKLVHLRRDKTLIETLMMDAKAQGLMTKSSHMHAAIEIR